MSRAAYHMPDIGVVWFPSKVDVWLGIALVLAPLVSLVALGASIMTADPAEIAVGAGAIVFVAALYAGVVVPVRYGVGGDVLIVRSGVWRQRLAYEAIVEVVPTRNLWSSPALSTDRLAVRTGRGLSHTTMISPADRETFLVMLATNAGLKREGDRLVRPGSR